MGDVSLWGYMRGIVIVVAWLYLNQWEYATDVSEDSTPDIENPLCETDNIVMLLLVIALGSL